MNIYDFLIVGAVAAWGLFSTFILYRRKKQGKSLTCSGNCSCCTSGCQGCKKDSKG